MNTPAYPSDVTEIEWEIVKGMIPKAKRGGRKRTVNVRQILNAIFYVLDNGIKWRSLPHDYPAWQTVYGYFQRWNADGTIEKIHRKLREIVRVSADKNADETVAIIDSQTAKTSEEACVSGYDAGKKSQRKEATPAR